MAPEGPLGFDEEPGEDPAAERRERLERRRERWDVAEASAPPDRDARGRQDRPALLASSGQYGWFVAVIGILLVLAFTLSNCGSDGPGSEGISKGGPAPPFAAPLALSKLAEAGSNDVNVATKAGQGDAGSVPACSVRRPDVLNFCALYEKGPVVLAFFATNDRCVKQLDVLDDVARRHPGVAFAAVSIRGDLADIRGLARDRGWSFPVGYDDDGILANAFGVAICPQVTYVRKGGRVADTSLGQTPAAALEARVRALER